MRIRIYCYLWVEKILPTLPFEGETDGKSTRATVLLSIWSESMRHMNFSLLGMIEMHVDT